MPANRRRDGNSDTEPEVEGAKKKRKPVTKKKAAAKKSSARGKTKLGEASAKPVARTKRSRMATPASHENTAEDVAQESSAADPFEVARRKMKGSVPEIVDKMLEMAKQGSCTHAKTLLEMTGAKHLFESPEGEAGDCWAKLVLERLDEAEADGRKLPKGRESALAEA